MERVFMHTRTYMNRLGDSQNQNLFPLGVRPKWRGQPTPPCENLLRAPNTRHVAPSRDLVRPGEATRGSRCAGRSALRAQASAHRLARIMSCQFDVRDDLDHQTLATFESTSTSGRSPVRVRREHVAPEASWKARLAERLHFCCSCEQ